MTASVPSGTDQSSRASPPEVVSPDTPALAMSVAMPFAASALLQLDRERFIGGEAIPGGERIAQRHDPDRMVGAHAMAACRQQALRRARDSDDPATYLHSAGESPI